MLARIPDGSIVVIDGLALGGLSGLLEAEAQLAKRPVSDLWMSAEECGERVLKGVQENDLYILTHPEFKKGLEEKFRAILKSFPNEPINEERAKAIAFLLRNPIFDEINER